MKTAANSNTFANAAPSTRDKAFCCCGLSRTFPICDGSQRIARTQKAEKLFSCGAAAFAQPEMHHLETT
jgi:CDGSH-type Zn-finger protein